MRLHLHPPPDALCWRPGDVFGRGVLQNLRNDHGR